MLEHAYYSVISPEGCAAILWKDQSKVESAANALKITSQYLKEIDIVDQVIPEPAGGAHLNPQNTAKLVDQQLHHGLQQLNSLSTQELLEQRYERFRLLGTVVDAPHVANLD